MKSAIINEYGNSNCFSIEPNLPEPIPAKNQIKIQVKAAGINPLDYRIRNGELKLFIPSQFPMILGNDAAGVVTEIGKDVTCFKVGDRVFGLLDANEYPSYRGFAKPGCYAEYAVSRENTLAQIPDNVDYISAAATPLAGLTAYQALHSTVKLQSGQSLLINGASGGVGTFAVQIAKAMGLKVTTVCSAVNIKLLQSLGADYCIDYKMERLENTEERFDVIYDVVANQTYSKLKHLLNPNGSYISNVANVSTITSSFLSKYFSLLGVKQHNYHAWVKSNDKDLDAIAGLMASNKVTPVIDKVFPLEQVGVAHELIQSGHTTGKLVLDLSGA